MLAPSIDHIHDNLPYAILIMDTNTILLLLTAIFLLRRRRRRLMKCKRIWVRPWISRREQYGAYYILMKELEREDADGYAAYQRITPKCFFELLEKIRPSIEKQNTKMRKCIPPDLRLAITLRYLATGIYLLNHEINIDLDTTK